MALDAGEVYVVVGAKLDSSSIAKANAAQRSLLNASNDYQRSIDRGEKAASRLHAANERWTRAAVVGAKAGAIGVAGVAAALGGAAVAAVSFDSAMRNVNSIAQLGEKNFKNLEKQVLRLAPSIGSSPTDLAAGLYDIVSTGFKAADAMRILAVAAKAGKAGLTDTATATDAITGALKAYGEGAGKAKEVSDLMFQTVDTGKLNFEQLAGSIGTVLAPASTLGVPLKELGAAIATLTLESIDADTATTDLRGIFTAFQKPTKDLTKVFKDAGYETATAGLKSLGLKGSLELLHKAVSSGHFAWVDFFKDVRALNGAQGLEGTVEHVKLFNSSTKAMNDAVKGAGATQLAWQEQQKSTAVQFDKLKASIDVAAITIGTALLPKINEGIGALSKWFAEAQKSGDLDRWAHEISNAVSEVVTFLHSLGPEASAAFHVVASTVQAAIPFVETLYKIFQTLEPAIEDVAHAASGLASALGPGPILAAVGAYLALKRAMTTAQVAQGAFARVMQAGEASIAANAGGIAVVGGGFTKVGTEAVKSASFAKIAAKGIASSFGPQLLVAGAAGIVASLVYVRGTMTTLKDEAQQAADAMLKLNDARLKVRSAKTDVKQATLDVAKAKEPLGSAAVKVANARAAVIASQGHPNAVADPAAVRALTAAEQDQAQKIINLQRANDRLTAAQKAAKDQTNNLSDAAKDLGKQYGGLSSHADGAVRSAQAAAQWSGKVRDKQKEASDAARIWANDLVKTAKGADGATAATIKQAQGVANLVREMGHVPNKTENKVIVDGLKAGRTVADIRKALIALGLLKPKVKVTADTKDANRDIDDTSRKAHALDNLKPDIPIKAHAVGVTAALASINSTILHFKANPFQIPIKYVTPAPPKGGHFNSKGQFVYEHATGHKTDGPEVALIGEGAAPEYVIPTEPKYRANGIALWMGAARDLGIPGFASGVRKPGSGGSLGRPLFSEEGPEFYAAAYRHNHAFAKDGPYQTKLSSKDELAFRAWVAKNRIPFDARAKTVDYDMRGYWKAHRGAGHAAGAHFPDTWKTPYDTTFSRESKYATGDNPFAWRGNRLIDMRTGQLIFGPPLAGYKAGVKKPGKTPPPIQHGLGYDPAALDTQRDTEKKRLGDARDYRDTLKGRLTTDGGRYAKLEEQLATAKKATGSKNKKTAAAAKTRVTKLTGQLNQLRNRMRAETTAYERQVNTVIPADTKRYEAATKAAKVGDDHAKKIDLWQTRADSDTAAMSQASDQWDAADRKKDPAGRDKAYKAWDAARKARVTDLGHVRDLLKEVKDVVGKTKYGAEIAGQLSTAIGSIVQAADDTQAPGYEAPDDSPPSTDINDYLYDSEKDANQSVALQEANAEGEAARAAGTADTADDVVAQQHLIDAAKATLGVATWIAGRLQQDKAPVDIITQALNDVTSAQQQLNSASEVSTPQITADQQAALDQATARATAADQNAASDRAALKTFQDSRELFAGRGGGSTVNVQVNTLTPGSPAMQRQIGEQVTGALGGQPSIPRSKGFYDG